MGELEGVESRDGVVEGWDGARHCGGRVAMKAVRCGERDVSRDKGGVIWRLTRVGAGSIWCERQGRLGGQRGLANQEGARVWRG